MEINKSNALRLWDIIYGDKTVVTDCFGTYMYREDYGNFENKRLWKEDNKYYNFGWEIDHILPLSRGGTDDNNNLEPMHWTNNREKADKNVFMIKNQYYQIYRCSLYVDGYRGYGIINQNSGKRIDWKYTTNRHF